jgi:nucleotide-binding universal stress UspA family protein
MNTIVVGTDGSPGADEALQWAAEEAALRHADLQIVSVYEYPTSIEALYGDLEKQLRTAAETTLERARAIVEQQCGSGTVTIHTTVAVGPPAPALIEAAGPADLLVIGAHGHGTFAGLLLGSVSLHCATHATCPVVVVRPATTR